MLPSKKTYHVKKALFLLLCLVLEHGGLNTIHDSLPDFMRIIDLLQETCVLANARYSCSGLLVRYR